MQVAVGPGQGRPGDVVHRGVGGKDQYARGVGHGFDLPADLYTGVLAEAQVEEDEIGAQLSGEPDGLGGVPGLARDLEPAGAKQVLQAEEYGGVVVDEQYPQRPPPNLTSTDAPSPGAPLERSAAPTPSALVRISPRPMPSVTSPGS